MACNPGAFPLTFSLPKGGNWLLGRAAALGKEGKNPGKRLSPYPIPLGAAKYPTPTLGNGSKTPIASTSGKFG
ncbi:hypothetical protein Tco_0973702 [Tanacetum coccineum]